MTDPKGEKPEHDHPHEDELPLDLHGDQAGLPSAEDHLPEALPTSASTDEFQFLGPVEELDFTEPADFVFPTETADVDGEHSGEFSAAAPAENQGLFGAELSSVAESPLPEGAALESVLAGEGIAEPGVAEKPAERKDKQSKPKTELPRWVRTAEWVTIGVLAIGGVLTLALSAILLDKSPKLVTLILNITCPVLLGLIPYALWRSMRRWSSPAASALYTIMLALSVAALIVGTWFEGLELSRYEWQFSKARVNTNKPRPAAFTPPAETKTEPAPDASAPPVSKNAVRAKNTASQVPEPAAAKGTAQRPNKK